MCSESRTGWISAGGDASAEGERMDQAGDPRLLADMARRFADRLVDDPTAFAWVFARYRAAEGVDDLTLAAFLGVAPELLAQIEICATPRPGLFREDITTVAERFGANPTRLAQVVRHVQALESLYQAPMGGHGLLAAARERVAEDGADYDGAGTANGSDASPKTSGQDR